MKLSVVISVHNQQPLAVTCFKHIRDNVEYLGYETEFIIIDNGSTQAIREDDFLGATVVRNEKNIGVYPTFKQGFEVAKGDIVAFFHSDLVIYEKGWNNRVIQAFKENPALGLLGFVGSNEIDLNGGRGGGTMSNFQGNTITDGARSWTGSPAHAHGKTITQFFRGAVVDGCAMIIHRSAWERIGYRENFPPHHFYDRLISTQMLEAGYWVGVLGIACDHISGQTVNQEQGYADMGEEWIEKKKDSVVEMIINSEPAMVISNRPTDQKIYMIAERMWLNEYRDNKHLVPIRI